MALTPQRVNRGSQLAADQVVGRDRIVGDLIDELERTSVLIGGDRRMGKTSILTKLEFEAPSHWLVVRLSLEGLSSPEEIAERLAEQVRERLGGSFHVHRLKRFLADLGIVGTGSFRLDGDVNWKSFLDRMFAHLGRSDDDPAAPKLVVFLLDEVPLAAGRIRDTSGPDDARDFLDRLRSLRQANPRVRMVLTGSIGFHHVLRSLSGSGAPSAPTNDLFAVDVAGLAADDAELLAARLLLGEKIPGDHEVLTSHIAAATAGVPFYIQHVVGALADLRSAVALTTVDVDASIDRALNDPKDAWNTAHYLERIRNYYGDLAALARSVLDALATTQEPISVNGLKARLDLTGPVDRDHLLEVVRLLRLDHYLSADMSELTMFHPIVRRAWRAQRGL